MRAAIIYDAGSAEWTPQDVAAVLSALYPASTVLLAWIFLKERLTWLQAVGVLLAFITIILFTL